MTSNVKNFGNDSEWLCSHEKWNKRSSSLGVNASISTMKNIYHRVVERYLFWGKGLRYLTDVVLEVSENKLDGLMMI